MDRSEGVVAVVGAGPIGLAAALCLAHVGVKVAVFEEDAGVSSQPKAGTLLARSLEIFAQIGVIDDVLKEGLRFDEIHFVERRTGEVLMRMLTHPLAGETPYPFTLNLPQDQLEPILLRHLLTTQGASIHFGHRLTSFADDGDGVTLDFETKDGRVQVRAPYLLACDGGHSTVRGLLGIPLDGRTYPERFAVIDARVDLDRDRKRQLTYLSYLFDPDEWIIAVRHPRFWRFLFPVPPEEKEPGPTEIEAKVRGAIGTEIPFEVLATSIYNVHQRVAAHFRKGRTFLLGDAAHLITPVGGLGLNTGLQDAQNLAWKIAWVMRQEAGDALLDTYEAERRPIARFIAMNLADRNRTIMRMRNPLQRWIRNSVLRYIEHSFPHNWSAAYVRTLLSTSYRPPREKNGLEARLRETLRPSIRLPIEAGDRCPDGVLFAADGRPVHLHDLLGTSFVALTFTNARIPGLALPDTRPALEGYVVSWQDATHDSNVRDRALYDIGGAITRRFGARPGSTYLVRPDGHLAAVGGPGGPSGDELYRAYLGAG